MRIAVYKDNLSTGRGADRAVRNFAAGLAERGHEAILFEKGELAARLDERWDAFVATGSNEIADLAAAAYFSKPGRAPVVLQLHLAPRGFFKWKHPLRNRAIRRAFDMPEAVQVLCASYKAEFSRIAPHPKVYTIGNYTEIAAPDDAQRQHFTEGTTILYPAAALTKVKNQKLAIKAFSLLADEFPEWCLRLLGRDDTRYAADCRKLVSRLRLEDRVMFVGFTRDLASEYSKASFVAFPSTLEGFPLAILESARFSLPAVAQRTLPGASDIILDGKTGLITDPSPRAYADGLRRLMMDASLRRKMGEMAHDHCEKVYSRENILNQWEELFSDVSFCAKPATTNLRMM